LECTRPVIGDWIGALYGMGGDRWEWRLSIFRDGSYARQVDSSRPPESRTNERGTWSTGENDKVLILTPNEGQASRWVIHDVDRLERAATLLVLRACMLASRNLPILLYRVHLHQEDWIKPYDAHGFDVT
jgi:hypothetical protein